MKRKADDNGLEGPAKRQLTEVTETASTAEETSSHAGSDDLSLSQTHADTHTPPTVLTEATTASGRRKFPSELKTIPCTVAGCGKMFNRPARLVAHLRSHNNERPYRCTYPDCDKAYSDNKHLKGHVLSAHTKEARFVCADCGKGFATGQRLKRHGLVHQGEERYKCRAYPPCTQSFRKHQTLQRHILRDHLGEKPYKCAHDGCDESYDTSNALKAHTTREHGERRFWCDECSAAAASAAAGAAADGEDGSGGSKGPVGFTTQFLLEQHVRQEHVNCIFCDGLKFGGHYELEQHMEIYHSGLTVKDRKTVSCDFEGCTKKFTKKSNMKAHYRTAHEGLRFVCGKVNTWESAGLEDWNWTEEGCGQGFTFKSALEQHVLYVHLGKKRPQYEPQPKGVPEDQASSWSDADEGNFLDVISGVADHERRPAVCTAPGCTARFTRYAYLHVHVQAEHPDRATFGPMGASEVPQPDWVDAGETNTGGRQNEETGEQWAQEDASLMQLLDLDSAIDPSLLIEA